MFWKRKKGEDVTGSAYQAYLKIKKSTLEKSQTNAAREKRGRTSSQEGIRKRKLKNPRKTKLKQMEAGRKGGGRPLKGESEREN